MDAQVNEGVRPSSLGVLAGTMWTGISVGSRRQIQKG